MTSYNNVLVIFSSPEEKYAKETVAFLEKNGFELKKSEVYGCFELFGKGGLASDSAIIFLSNVALSDSEWKAQVEGVSDSFRLIPIRGVGSIDYSKKEEVVGKLREINYIKVGGDYLLDILDALYTEPSFYGIRNEVMIMMNAWEMSGKDDAYLMADWKKNRQYIRLFNKAYDRENNPKIKQRLNEILDYLKKSSKRSAAYFGRGAWRYLKIAVYTIIGAVLLALLIFVRSRLKRAFYSEALLGFDMRNQQPTIAAIKLVEGMSNPFVSDDTKSRYYQEMIELLGQNWDNTPLGLGFYKWALNDATVLDDSRYILTANGKGQAVTWDTYTGEIVKRENISLNPLASITRTKTGVSFVIDSSGEIFVSQKDDSWKDTNVKCEVEFSDALRIDSIGDGKRIMISDDTHCYVFDYIDESLSSAWSKNFDNIFDSELNDDGTVVLAVQDGKSDCIFLYKGAEEIKYSIQGNINDRCYPDIKGTRVLYADDEGCIFIWDILSMDEPEMTGLVLTDPIALSLSEKDYIAYHDRNAGTQVYDLKLKTVLADCIGYQNVVSRLEVENDILMVYAQGKIYSEDLKDIQPLSELPAPERRVYSGKSDAGSGKTVKSISVENDYIVKLLLSLPEEKTVIFDSSTRYFIGEAERDDSLLEGIPDEYAYYSTMGVHFLGKPTVVGIVPDKETILISAQDGTFYEIVIGDDGSGLIASKTQIPTRLPIVAIHQTDDAYFLEDSVGNLWKERIGYNGAYSYDRLYEEVRDKIRYGVYDDLLDQISDETESLLQLHHFSVPYEKEWE